MDSNDFYNQILGLEKPWRVNEVKLDMSNETVHVYVEYDKSAGALRCNACGCECPGYDTQSERIWRHLDTCQLMTYLVCSVPRVLCPKDGVRIAKVPWAEPKSRFTLLFERFAITLLLDVKVQQKVAKQLRLSPDSIHIIMKHAVDRGLVRRDTNIVRKVLAIDEKSIAAGHEYMTVLSDTQRAIVIDVAEGRKQKDAQSLLKKNLTPAQREEVRCVTMDMWKAFINAVKKVLPDADIAHDRFHIAGYLNEAVDNTRRSEHSRLLKEGNSALNKSRYLWLKNYENLNEKQAALFLAMITNELETHKVWSMKETFREFFDCTTKKEAEAFFLNWYEQAIFIGNKYITKVADMLKSHLEGLLAVIEHKATNAIAEAINSKIQALKTSARGYRTFNNYRNAILFFFGGLDLYPQKSQ